jgi:hypothetical protein
MENEINKKLTEIHEKICMVDHDLYLEESSGVRNNPYTIERLLKQRDYLISCEMELMTQLKNEVIYE